ncbi:MAG: hypothetical protein JWO53_430 [Chlamydiia bacterium]|nr:hypothetical protein [Chlamydiia bacterium]
MRKIYALCVWCSLFFVYALLSASHVISGDIVTSGTQNLPKNQCPSPSIADLPLWIDFKRVFVNSRDDKAGFCLPLICNGASYTVVYEASEDGEHIERVLLMEGSGSKPLSIGHFRWNKELLTDFWLENSDGQTFIQDSLIYSEEGLLQKTVTTRQTKKGLVSKRCRYNNQGKLIVEKIIQPDGEETLYKWSYDDLGTLVKEKKRVKQELPKKISSTEELCYLPDGVFQKEYRNFVDKRLVSHRILEWQMNEQKVPVFVRVIGARGGVRQTNYFYDGENRLIKKVKPDGIELFYDYDTAGKLTHISSSDASVVVALRYDSKGNICEAEDALSGTVKREFSDKSQLLKEEVNGLYISYSFDAQGKKTEMILPDTSRLTYRYTDEELTSIGRFSSDNILLYEYMPSTREPSYEITDDEKSFSVKAEDSQGKYEQHVTYDAFDQLAQESGEFQQQYLFDGQGNCLEKNGYKTVLNEFSELISDTKGEYEYDTNGNVISHTKNGERFEYHYDALDRLIRVSKNGQLIEEQSYDIFYRRIKTTKPNGIVYYFFDGNEEIGSWEENKIQDLKIGAGSSPWLIELQGKPYQISTDFRLSISSLIDIATGKVAEAYRYGAFGEEKIFNNQGTIVTRSVIKNFWRFGGKRISEETGLSFFEARYYSSGLIRFLSQDPLSFIDGVNTTGFVANDPMRFVDPTGLFALPINMQVLQKQVNESILDMYNKTIQTVTFARGQLKGFLDFRSHFEDAAFKIMNKTVWTLFGYNPDPTSMHFVDGGKVSDNVRITFINGILNTYANATDTAKLISELHGSTAVHYLYAASSGFTADILRSIFAKIGFSTPQARLLADTWKKLIKELGGVTSGGRVIHYAHSLGGIDTYRALGLLTEEERAMLHITTFASPSLIEEGACHYVKNYVSTNDLIPLFSPLRYREAKKGTGKNVTFLESEDKIPFRDHSLVQEPYRTTLEELGRKFQQEYLSSSGLLSKSHSKSTKKKKRTTHSASPLIQETAFTASEKISKAILSKNYQALRKYISLNVPHVVTYQELQSIAVQLHFEPLLLAMQATDAIFQIETNLGLKREDVLQLALFIESDLKVWITEKRYYLTKSKTGLARTIEYDPKSRNTFIHLGTEGIEKIGEGWHKVVTKSILYSSEKPEIVANCRTSLEDKEEMNIIKSLQGIPGIVQGKAFITHRKNKTHEDKLEIILKLYNGGSLHRLQYLKDQKFSLVEKMKIALDLLTGLSGMHAKGLIHRDLHSGNHLLDISYYPGGVRKIDAAITDFGKTLPKDQCPGQEVQAYRWYMPPEGFFPNKMKADDYFYSDVYAIGCVFYAFYHEQPPIWFQDDLFKNLYDKSDKKKKIDQQRHIRYLLQTTDERREVLYQKRDSLTFEEKFEYLILQMLSLNPRDRGTAESLRQELAALYSMATSVMQAS